MAAGKCPTCGNYVTVVNTNGITIRSGERSYKGVTYQCPNIGCQTVLGCELDPIALKNDIVNAVNKQLQSY